jgi:polar amino acid transport system substrate-binding protein
VHERENQPFRRTGLFSCDDSGTLAAPDAPKGGRGMSRLKKLVACGLVACVAALALAVVTAQAQDKGVEAIKKKGTLVVGTASGYYPFEMVDKKNELVGFDVDIAKAIAKELGVRVEFQNYAFAGLIPALQASKIDMVLAGMTATEKRKETVDFSDAYFISGLGMLVSKSVPNVKKPEDLDKKDYVIGVSMGTTGDQAATRIFKNATVKKFDGSALAGLEVINGKAQAVIHDTPWVAIYNRRNQETTYAVLEPFTTEPLGIAIPKGNPELVTWLNAFLKKYKEAGEYKKSYAYWFVDMPWWESVTPKN